MDGRHDPIIAPESCPLIDEEGRITMPPQETESMNRASIWLPHMITIGVMVVSLSATWARMDTRIDALERTQIRADAAQSNIESKLERRLEKLQGDITTIKEQLFTQAIDFEREKNGRGIQRRN